jgi:hypothetical protein
VADIEVQVTVKSKYEVKGDGVTVTCGKQRSEDFERVALESELLVA